MKTKGCAHTCTLVGVPDCWGGRVQYDHHPLARRRAVKPFLCGARTSRWLHCLGHPSVFQRQFSMRARENAASNGCRGVRLDGPWRHGVEIIAYLARRCTRLRIAIYAASGAQRDLVRVGPLAKSCSKLAFDAPYLWLGHGRPVDNCRCPWLRHAQDVRLGACVFRQIPLGSRPVQVRAFFVPGRRARRDRIQPHRVNGPLRARHHGPDLCHA